MRDIFTGNLTLRGEAGGWTLLQGEHRAGHIGAELADGRLTLSWQLEAGFPLAGEAARAIADEAFFALGCREAVMALPPGAQGPAGDRVRREDWLGLEQGRPFGDVFCIEGEEIDLQCSCVFEENREQGIVPAYWFDIYPHDCPQAVGRIDLRLGYTEKTYYGGNIGYGIQQEFRGRGYARKACQLLVPLIRRHGMHPVLITCRTDNIPSQRTCLGLGAQPVRRILLPQHTDLYEKGDREIWLYYWQP